MTGFALDAKCSLHVLSAVRSLWYNQRMVLQRGYGGRDRNKTSFDIYFFSFFYIVPQRKSNNKSPCICQQNNGKACHRCSRSFHNKCALALSSEKGRKGRKWFCNECIDLGGGVDVDAILSLRTKEGCFGLEVQDTIFCARNEDILHVLMAQIPFGGASLKIGVGEDR